jgi:hypothetical protein
VLIGVGRDMNEQEFRDLVGKRLQWTFPNALDLGSVTTKMAGAGGG